MKRFIQITIIIAMLPIALWANSYDKKENNTKTYLRVCVAFYNQENLFDTIHQPNVNDFDFTPSGANAWTQERYKIKLNNMAQVISEIGGDAPAILGVSEIENRTVLEDLINTDALKDKGYNIIHYDSPDARGIDCALLYRIGIFNPTNSKAIPTVIPGEPENKTRDILLASGTIDGEEFHFMVAHWPSRVGGEKASEHRRMAAAKLMKEATDSILKINPKAKIIMMGDMNDDPNNKSFRKGLGTKKSPKNLKYDELFCPMLPIFKSGIGTLAYRDVWNLFDNIIVNGNLINKDYSSFRLQKNKKGFYAYIFKAPYMLQQEGKYKGYPLRTFAGGQFMAGYSDHFPVYVNLIKEVKKN